jgi:hypothetical protein
MAPPSYQQDLEAGCCVVKVANQNKECVAGCGGCLGLALTLFLIVLLSSIKVVEVNQQLVFSNSEGKWVRNGPFTAVVWPTSAWRAGRPPAWGRGSTSC